eukprot:CAMPEP_0181248218 /NCGR_PEP_ID=MMETSP1096-20121128/45045_1 /TAXON_ID=156174 ORGANISM="Chrysochromulina ericina, Strain CCMP281" /NCGR_SAMPLE_ID=MMETSP1096 /ASSEMBLY_ACC=CAM_ASM_000453 /LENGTH=81 /DNA_ID=CAMNT_0023345357 /DNA_START=1145 /DNA_END=1391 /DNA_ORIENTATION=+
MTDWSRAPMIADAERIKLPHQHARLSHLVARVATLPPCVEHVEAEAAAWWGWRWGCCGRQRDGARAPVLQAAAVTVAAEIA